MQEAWGCGVRSLGLQDFSKEGSDADTQCKSLPDSVDPGGQLHNLPTSHLLPKEV